MEIERFHHTSNIIGQPVIVISMPRLIGFTESSGVHSNASISQLGKLIKLIFKQPMVAWPTMNK
jgi:hypothetical protein